MYQVPTMKKVLADAGYSGPELRYAYVMLFEPDHATLDKFYTGQLAEVPLDQDTNVTRDFVVDVVARRIVKEVELDAKTDGQIPILDQDYWDGDSICKADPDYVAASPASTLCAANSSRPVSVATRVSKMYIAYQVTYALTYLHSLHRVVALRPQVSQHHLQTPSPQELNSKVWSLTHPLGHLSRWTNTVALRRKGGFAQRSDLGAGHSGCSLLPTTRARAWDEKEKNLPNVYTSQ
ncbi:hypothetical protein V7S43_005274 [Phytophthora oleae]|uniref:PiggyBac transposable element-derived protein domain-containing protein n=1 Tax=Phytophthora oleae TaxID=2107226 RepID=A0ABD3FUJ4_9STRA